MIHHITFTDSNMRKSAQLCVESSKAHGAETHARFTPANVGKWPEVQSHPEIFRQPDNPARAWGWWAWKPLIIAKEMSWLPDGAILIYSDAGVEFINNVNFIIDRMGQSKKIGRTKGVGGYGDVWLTPGRDIFLFGNNWEHAHWCKRDVVEAVWPLSLNDITADDDGSFMDWWRAKGWSRFSKQVQASVVFIRVSDYSRAFVKEWLHWCLFKTFPHPTAPQYLIDDSPSRTPNHPEFREHRHDQAILTTLAYREGIKLHWWPASYNDGAFTYEKLSEYAGDDYPVLFNHHRKRNVDWDTI